MRIVFDESKNNRARIQLYCHNSDMTGVYIEVMNLKWKWCLTKTVSQHDCCEFLDIAQGSTYRSIAKFHLLEEMKQQKAIPSAVGEDEKLETLYISFTMNMQLLREKYKLNDNNLVE